MRRGRGEGVDVDKVGWSQLQSGFCHTIQSKSEFSLSFGLSSPRLRFSLVLTLVSLDHGYVYLKRDKYINVY